MGTVTFGSTYKPAEVSALEFPGGTIFLTVAVFFLPAGSKAVFSAPLIYQQEIDLSFNVRRDCSPTLLVTVDSLERHSQEFC